jgi:FAD/FMN-containing dehydrogenase
VGGSTLCGGFSWLSGEFGCLSDPQNMFDMQVVKLDGSVLWASEEPELLWAMRGTEGAFAVAVAFKLRCFKYPERVWSGPILLPNTATVRKQICTGILNMDVDQPEPRVALFLYRMAPDILKAIGDGKNGNMIVVHAFDARGEDTGRKEFDWALSVPGAIDRTCYQTRKELAMMQCESSLL